MVPWATQGEDGTSVLVDNELTCGDVLDGDLDQEAPLHIRRTIEDFRLECERRMEEELESRNGLLTDVTLPGSLVQGLNLVQGLGVVLLAIMTASLVGAEFGQGTLRTVVARGVERWQFLSAKFVLLAMFAGVVLAIVVIATALSSVIVGLIESQRPETQPEWAEVAATFGRAWFSLLPYIALAGLFSVMASSSTVGMAIVIGYLFIEVTVTAVLLNLFDGFQNVANYLLGRNTTAWMMGSGQDEPQLSLGTSTPVGDFPDVLHAFLVLAAYVLVLVGLAIWHLHRKDIGGARGA